MHKMPNVAGIGPAAVAIDGISRRFGNVEALRDVSLEIGRGEIVTLVGESGCGKSTLLRVIAGVEHADAGRLSLDGDLVAGGGVFVEPEHRSIGFMFQDYALFPHLTVRQNVLFGLRKMGRDAAGRRADETIRRIGISALASRYPHMLSGGEQQRVALARALAPQPRVLLMDEPFSNLDRRLRDVIRRETIALLRSLGTTAVLVTHDPEEALSAGDRVVLMHAGKIVEKGTGDEIYSRPASAYSAEFFSRFNLVPARVAQNCLECPIGVFPLPASVAASSGEVALYVRPEALSLAASGIPARIEARVLLGEIEELTLAVEGLAQPLTLRATHRCNREVGAAVYLQVDAGQILAFKAG